MEQNEKYDVRSKGELIYKSTTPKRKSHIFLNFFFSTLFTTAFILMFSIFLSWLFAFLIESPEYLIFTTPFLLLSIITGLFSLVFYALSIDPYLTHLYIYKNGIETRARVFLFFRLKKKFTTFQQIDDLEIKKDYFGLNTLFINLKNEKLINVDENKVSDLEEAKNIIMDMILKK